MPTTVIHKYSTNEQKIALTIDDGPYAEQEADGRTSRILDELSLRGLKATFFLIGWRVHRMFKESIPGVPGSGTDPSNGLLARFIAEGHEVCNHTYHHPPNYPVTTDPCARLYVPDLPPNTSLCSWKGTIKLFRRAVNRRRYRPPGIVFYENLDFWRSPHFTGTDPDNPALRSLTRPQTNQRMVDFIYDQVGPVGQPRPVTATSGLQLPVERPTRKALREYAERLRGKYLEPQGSIVIAHQSDADLARFRGLSVLARRRGFQITTLGSVKSGATGDV